MPGKSRKKILVSFLIIAACVGLVFLLKFLKTVITPAVSIPSQPVRSKGNPQALVKIVEYMDYQCPACAKGTNILNEYLKHYPGKLYLDAKYFPLEMHIHGMRAARYAECSSRQGKFWLVHDQLFRTQDRWKDQINPEAIFSEILTGSKIDTVQLQQCLDDPAVSDLIMKDREEGNTRGVKSTPTYFVNDKMIVGSLNLENELKSLLGNLPVTNSAIK